MGQRVAFEWHISDPDPDTKLVHVRERLVGHDGHNLYGPMRASVAQSFIKARRAAIHRNIHTKFQALQVFEPRPQLIDLAKAQRKPRYED
jgi:hypothetical protein